MQEYISDLLKQWQLPPYAWNLIIVAASLLLGILLGLMVTFFVKKQTLPEQSNRLLPSAFRHLGMPLSYWFPLFVFDLFVPVLQMNRIIRQRVDHAVEIGLIICSAWVLIGFIKLLQNQIYRKVNIKTPDNLRQRTIITQLIYIRRVITVIIILVTIGAVLLTFSTMRKVGTGLLTGVGVGGIIVGFAAQRSLANLLAGFQIAFTQPIRIDDEVIVENEFGKIEEITLTYVVVRIWDERRMVMPINFFIEKPFQNWTRTGSAMIGSVFIYADYTLPVDWLREQFMRLVAQHPLWDKRLAVFQVTNLKENVVELRGIVSGHNSGHLWDLRCYLREELLKAINEHYPQCLPQLRLQASPVQADAATGPSHTVPPSPPPSSR